METRVGDHCLLMVGTHVAHDCIVGDHVIMANNATLAGHVTVGSHVIIGGLSAVQQFVRIGDHAIIGGMSGVEKDIIPYAMVVGERAHINGLNLVGLRRRGFSNQSIQEIMRAYEQLFDVTSNTTFMERVDTLAQNASQDEAIQHLIRFIQEDSKRRLCTPKTY
jgi:UDP-N-acetylglucosamine acyltransferase